MWSSTISSATGSSAEVAAEREHDLRVVVEDEQDRACHGLPPSRSGGTRKQLIGYVTPLVSHAAPPAPLVDSVKPE
jgi:hypothetical protein